ncbi:hypothetical protein Vafri_15857 [Volvox africanus]|uniref:Uncharacterized protein n=2 Tax=Volvox africanus TaxID=51714 RepID=A0A8J4BHL4_9CHLO|nr:hypothetical protein Vafri_15857 [Volvox africanus]
MIPGAALKPDFASAAAGAASTTASPLTLSCSPESEARVYEALHPPPWRPWQHLRIGFGANPKHAGCSPGYDSQGNAAGAGGHVSDHSNKSSGNAHGSSSSSSSLGQADDASHRTHGGCRLAIAVGREVGLHADLARRGAQVADLVPGTKLIRSVLNAGVRVERVQWVEALGYTKLH